MAAAPTPQPQAPPPSAPPQAAPGAGNSPNGGPAVLQLVALISKASDQLASVFAAGAPMVEEIQNQLSLIQQKMAETTSPQQPAAPPI
jgi:hypothetical protein